MSPDPLQIVFVHPDKPAMRLSLHPTQMLPRDEVEAHGRKAFELYPGELDGYKLKIADLSDESVPTATVANDMGLRGRLRAKIKDDPAFWNTVDRNKVFLLAQGMLDFLYDGTPTSVPRDGHHLNFPVNVALVKSSENNRFVLSCGFNLQDS